MLCYDVYCCLLIKKCCRIPAAKKAVVPVGPGPGKTNAVLQHFHQLDIITAGIVEHCNFYRTHFGRLYAEMYAQLC